jgi:hypothetical protein
LSSNPIIYTADAGHFTNENHFRGIFIAALRLTDKKQPEVSLSVEPTSGFSLLPLEVL